jgi:predicted P-loop ATPase
VFAGTTNSDAYFGDETGNRRFWPVRVGTIDLDRLHRDRDQLWAEAVVSFKAGEHWWLDRKVEAAAAEEQAERRIVDPWEERLLDWAAEREEVSVEGGLAAVGMPVERYTQADANRVARILKANGWERVRVRVGRARTYVYRRAGCPPLSPVPEEQSGDKEASKSAAVPSVPSVPTCSDTHAHAPAGKVAEPPWSTGDTRDSGDRPAWTDDREWSRRIGKAGHFQDKVRLVAAWAEAAGGNVSTLNEAVRLHLPPGLPNGMALAELRRFADQFHLKVTTGSRA